MVQSSACALEVSNSGIVCLLDDVLKIHQAKVEHSSLVAVHNTDLVQTLSTSEVGFTGNVGFSDSVLEIHETEIELGGSITVDNADFIHSLESFEVCLSTDVGSIDNISKVGESDIRSLASLSVGDPVVSGTSTVEVDMTSSLEVVKSVVKVHETEVKLGGRITIDGSNLIQAFNSSEVGLTTNVCCLDDVLKVLEIIVLITIFHLINSKCVPSSLFCGSWLGDIS